MNSAISLPHSASRASAPLRTLGLSSELPELRFQGHNGLLCPHVPPPPPRPNPSCIHGVLLLWWEQPGVVQEGVGSWHRDWRRQAMVSSQHASHIRRHCHRACQPCTEWRRSWASESLRRVPSGPHTTCFLSGQPLGSIQVGGFSLAFSASCYFGATLGHQPSPGCKKGLSAAAQLGLHEESGGKWLGGESG